MQAAFHPHTPACAPRSARRCAEAFAREPQKGWEQVAREKLRSGEPAGIAVLRTCAAFVRSHRAESEFPFLARVDRICAGKAAPESLTEMAVPRVRASKAMKARSSPSTMLGLET